MTEIQPNLIKAVTKMDVYCLIIFVIVYLRNLQANLAIVKAQMYVVIYWN